MDQWFIVGLDDDVEAAEVIEADLADAKIEIKGVLTEDAGERWYLRYGEIKLSVPAAES
jgi:hypothetical protein